MQEGRRMETDFIFDLDCYPEKERKWVFFFPQPIYLPTHLPCRRVYEISIWRFAHLMPDFLVWKLGLDRRKECGGKACPQCFRSLGNGGRNAEDLMTPASKDESAGVMHIQ